MCMKCIFATFFGVAFYFTNTIALAQSVPLTRESYLRDGATKGVVLLSVRWDRKWNCAGFKNAQLRLIGFDLLPSKHLIDDDAVDLLLDDAPLIMTKPNFDDYAFLIDPGQYALSRLHIKVARSVSDVGVAKIGRDHLLKDGVPDGGTFNVEAGEVVYIGHFSIDCYKEPILWRFYIEDKNGFGNYLIRQKEKIPELDISKAKFRLFKSKYFGRDYDLK